MADYRKKEEGVRLDDESRVRMVRLFGEVQGRIQEMSVIVARAHKNSSQWRSATFFLGQAPDGTASVDFNGAEIIQNCSGDDAGCCVVYDNDEGTCSPC